MAALLAGQASAAVLSITPSNPTAADVIYIELLTPYTELVLQPVVVTGSQIEITFRGYATLPSFGSDTASVGPLPAGVYTIVVRHVLEDGSGNVVQTITDPPVTFTVVDAAFIPVLDPSRLLLLIAALSLSAVVALGRR